MPPTLFRPASPLSLSIIKSLSLSIEEVLLAAGLRHEQEIRREDAAAIWAALERLTGDPCVGLESGRRFEIDQMGPVGPGFAHSPDLRVALTRSSRLIDLLLGGGVSFVEREAGGGIEARMLDASMRHGVDAIFAGVTTLARKSLRGAVVPMCVELQSRRPTQASARRYQAFFGQMPEWSRPRNALLFSRADLDRRCWGASPALAALIDEAAPKLVAAEPPELTRDFELAFWAAQARGAADLDTVARTMGLSGRTLQRQLHERQTDFSGERARLLESRARQLLRTDLSVEEVSERLGYRSRRAFERAFRRWTGRSPASWREDAG